VGVLSIILSLLWKVCSITHVGVCSIIPALLWESVPLL
jgi:uncharacterized membrane protein YqgA involved in biofilm formation